MYPGTAPDSKSPFRTPAPWRPAQSGASGSRRTAPAGPAHDPAVRAAAEHDPALLVAALEAIERRDAALEWLLEAGLLGMLLAG
jgi:hypothetical protein